MTLTPVEHAALTTLAETVEQLTHQRDRAQELLGHARRVSDDRAQEIDTVRAAVRLLIVRIDERIHPVDRDWPELAAVRQLLGEAVP